MPNLAIDIKTVAVWGVTIVGWTLSLATLYYGLTAQNERTAASLAEALKAMAAQTEQIKTLDTNQRAQERALLELTTTLRVLKVVQ